MTMWIDLVDSLAKLSRSRMLLATSLISSPYSYLHSEKLEVSVKKIRLREPGDDASIILTMTITVLLCTIQREELTDTASWCVTVSQLRLFAFFIWSPAFRPLFAAFDPGSTDDTNIPIPCSEPPRMLKPHSPSTFRLISIFFTPSLESDFFFFRGVARPYSKASWLNLDRSLGLMYESRIGMSNCLFWFVLRTWLRHSTNALMCLLLW